MTGRPATFRETLGRIEALQTEIDRAYDACNDPELPASIHENVIALKRLVAAAANLTIQSDDDAIRALELVGAETPIPYAGLVTAAISYLSKRHVP